MLCSVPFLAFFNVFFLRAGITLFNKLFVKVPDKVQEHGMQTHYYDEGAVPEPSFIMTYLFLVGVYFVLNLLWFVASPMLASNLGLDLQVSSHYFLMTVITVVSNTILMAIMLSQFLATPFSRALTIAIFQMVIGAVIVGVLMGIYFAVSPY